MQVANGTTDVTTYFVLRDSTNHAPKTDVTVTDIDLYYCEQGAAMAAKVDATALAAADSAHADNKAFHVGQGLYRVDWPDTCFDGGVGKVVNLIVVCADVDTTFLEVELTGVAQTGDSYARLGAPVGASISADIATIDGNVDSILTDTSTTLDALIKDIPTVAEFEARTIAAADYTVVSDLGTVQTGDAYAVVSNVTYGNSALATLIGTVDGIVDDILEDTGTTLDGKIDTIDGIVDDILADTGTDGVVLADDAITSAKFDESSAYPLKSADTGATAVARTGADADTLETLSDQLDDVPTVAEFEARTLIAASYFDPAADTVAHVTLVDTTTTNTDMVSEPPAVADIADGVWDEALAGHAVAGSAGATLSAASAPTADAVADAVWEEAIADHSGTVGSTAESLAAAGAAGDPWITALPGAYADGTAGDIIGNLVADVGALTPAVAISTTTAASVSSGALAVRTHHSLSQAISSTYAGDLSAATKLWLAVKAEKDDTDAQAVIFIEETAGLTVLAGAAYTTVAHGSLTVGGLAGAWTVTVAIDEVATGLLTPYADGMLWAECKALVAGSTVAVWDGVCDVARGIVVAVS